MEAYDWVGKFADHIRRGFEVITEGEHFDLITPYYLPNGDAYEVRLSPGFDQLRLSDAGFLVDYLLSNGLDPDSLDGSRLELFQAALNGYQVSYGEGEFYVEGSEENFPDCLHRLISAMQEVACLTFTARPQQRRDFRSIVRSYLREYRPGITENGDVYGCAGVPHRVDVSLEVGQSLMVVLALSVPPSSSANALAEHTAFVFEDIRKLRSQSGLNGFKGLAVLDDRSHSWPSKSQRILAKYADDLIPWSTRERIIGYVTK